MRLAAALFLGLAVVIAVVGIAAGWDSWVALQEEAAGFAWRSRPLPLAGALVAGAGALLSTGWVWGVLFRRAGGRAGTGEAAAAWLGSNLGRYLPGKIWQLTGITAWLNARGDSGAAGFATSLALQAVMLVTGAGLGLMFGGAALGGGAGWWAALGVVLLALLHPGVLNALIRRLSVVLREPEPEHGLDAPAIVLAAFAAVAIWSLYGAGLWLLVLGLAPDFAPAPHVATGMFAAAYVAGYVVLIAPGGLVVREGALAGLLAVGTGLPVGAAAAIAVAARIWTTVAELAAFGLAGLGLRRDRPEG